MPKKMNNNKKKINTDKKNKKYESSSEDLVSTHDSEDTCDSQSEIVNSSSSGTCSVSDDTTDSEDVSKSDSTDMTVSEDDSSAVSEDSSSASEDTTSENDEPVYVKSKKNVRIKSKKIVHVKPKTTYVKPKKTILVQLKKKGRVASKDPLQNVIKIDKKENGKDIREICFENINEQYSLGRYDDFPVIVANQNGYMNATKLCQEIAKQMGSKKILKDFFGTAHNKEIVKAVSLYTGIDVNDLKFLVQGGMKETKGTYVHNLLITHIASWASPKFAVKVSVIVNEYLSMREKEKNDSLLRKKDDKINELFILNKKSDAKLDKLIKINKKQDKKLDENNVTMDQLLVTNKKQEAKLHDMGKDLKHALQTRDIVSDDLDKKCHHVVVKTGALKDDNILIIMKKNSPPPEESDDNDEVDYKYYVARTNKENRESTIARQKKSHENLTILMEIKYVPNSVMLWKNVCNSIAKGKKNKITVSRNDFNLSDNYTEREFIKDIKNIFDKRLNRVNIID
jgi:hypothetical protein